MGEIITLPDNFMTLSDRKALQSFGGREISHGRAFRYEWGQNKNGDPIFKIYSTEEDGRLILSILRNRKKHIYTVYNHEGEYVVSGKLDQVMAVLDRRLTHSNGGDVPA